MTLTRRSLAHHVRVTKRGCWLWKRARTGEGYGALRLGRALCYAHRVVYELFHGPLPAGALVCHECDTPACVRPSHLYAGNNSTNMRDAWARGRRVA